MTVRPPSPFEKIAVQAVAMFLTKLIIKFAERRRAR